MTEDRKAKVIGKINEIKSNIETFISDVNVNDLKKSFNLLVKDAQADFQRVVNKDLEAVKAKLHKEKADYEKKAKEFLAKHKKEIEVLQAKLAKLQGKAPVKTTTKKVATTKKVPTTKRVARATKKVAKKA